MAANQLRRRSHYFHGGFGSGRGIIAGARKSLIARRKTRKYFHSCFIGTDTNTNRKVIFISNIKTPIKEIKFNIGEIVITIDTPPLNEHKCIDIVFNDEIPTKLEVLSINGETINEEIDKVLDEDYWRFNKIEDN